MFKQSFKQKMYDNRKHYIESIKILAGCKDCGIQDPEMLSFDHVRGEKKFNICSRWDVSMAKLQLEIAKCEVVCHNCHAKRTIQRHRAKDNGFPPFQPFPKIPRLSRPIEITEKIDGTNAMVWVDGDEDVWCGSKNRWLNKENDNFGFAVWVEQHEEDFKKAGEGLYQGEWYGNGIQRKYGLADKHFILFNPHHYDNNDKPKCCEIIPILWEGIFNIDIINQTLITLKEHGSYAVPGWMKPEGIIIYHTASRTMFKKTLENDEKGKEQ